MSQTERDEASRRSRENGKEKVAAALERLDAAVTRICTEDEAFREYLRVSGRLHSYSWGNRLLIMLQRDTRMVAGFRRWKELDRPVKKGAKGIQILAPMVVKREVDKELAGYSTSDGTVGGDGTLTKLVGFRVAYVFAVEDTEGAPIQLPQPLPEADDSPESAQICERLLQTANRLGIPVEVCRSDPRLGDGTDGKPAGWADLSERRIVLNGDLPAAARAKTLAHEVAHLVADHHAHGDTRSDAEAVAEGAAFVIAAHHGLDTAGYSAPYIAGWSQDIARVRSLLERIARVSSQIIGHSDECSGSSESQSGD